MSLVNLTPHPIRVYNNDTPDRLEDPTSGLLFKVDPMEKPARIAMIDLGQAGTVMDEYASGHTTWVEWIEFGRVHDLPEPEQGTTFIVSLVVALACARRDRPDLVFPMSEVRNMDGTVIGCRGFGRVC
jgi:hypothetical protein